MFHWDVADARHRPLLPDTVHTSPLGECLRWTHWAPGTCAWQADPALCWRCQAAGRRQRVAGAWAARTVGSRRLKGEGERNKEREFSERDEDQREREEAGEEAREGGIGGGRKRGRMGAREREREKERRGTKESYNRMKKAK